MLESRRGLVVVVLSLLGACGARQPTLGTGGTGGIGGAPAAPAAGRLEERYDPSRDATLVRVVPAVEPGVARLLAGATYPGRTLATPPESVLIGFRRSTAAWRYAECAAIGLFADGVKLTDGPALRDTELGAGSLVEYLTTAVPLASAARLAWAGRAELQACGETIALPREDRELLSRFVKRLTPP